MPSLPRSKTHSPFVLLALALAPLALASACGHGSSSNKSQSNDKVQGAKLGGDSPCYANSLNLGQPTNEGQSPGQIPPPPPTKGQEPCPPIATPAPIPPPPPVVPVPPPPPPCDKDCGAFNPIPNPPTNGPGQIPGQFPTGGGPINPPDCGKGYLCDHGGGHWDWPTHDKGGQPFVRHDVEACLGYYRGQGVNTQGQWQIDVRRQTTVNVLSEMIIRDGGNIPTIVMIDAVGVLGHARFELFNPNALYCVKSVAVLETMSFASCHPGNIAFGKSVDVLSRVDSSVYACQ